MPNIAQDDYLIQAAIALMIADVDVNAIVGTRILQKGTPVTGVTTPYVTVGWDFDAKVLGVPSNRGTFIVAGWYDDDPATNLSLLRQLMADIIPLFNVDHAVASILSQKAGLKLRYLGLRDAPYLHDDTDSLYYCSSEFDGILDT